MPSSIIQPSNHPIIQSSNHTMISLICLTPLDRWGDRENIYFAQKPVFNMSCRMRLFYVFCLTHAIRTYHNTQCNGYRRTHLPDAFFRIYYFWTKIGVRGGAPRTAYFFPGAMGGGVSQRPVFPCRSSVRPAPLPGAWNP